MKEKASVLIDIKNEIKKAAYDLSDCHVFFTISEITGKINKALDETLDQETLEISEKINKAINETLDQSLERSAKDKRAIEDIPFFQRKNDGKKFLKL